MNNSVDRRTVLKGTVAAIGAAATATFPFARASAATFPERNINVFVPTREGGGADRNLRAFTGVWKKYLNTNFEASFFPGAAGRVGYEKYMGLAEPDGHNLLFGNMGPEVLNWVVKPPTFDLADFMYFAQVDQDPGNIFLSRESKLQTIDDIVAEGKKRTLNVGVSRLAHPATLGALALARHTGAEFNPVPLSGGRNTIAGVVTGEMDFGALPTGTVLGRADKVKVVLMMSHTNPIPDRTDNAPVMNDHFGMDLPSLIAGARAFGIKREAIDKFPERFEILTDTLKNVFTDPDYKEAIVKTGAPWEFIKHGGPEDAAAYVENITAIGEEFKDLLTGEA